MRTLAALVLALGAGCSLYFGAEDESRCFEGASDLVAASQYRNPETGECERFAQNNEPTCDREGQDDSAEPGAPAAYFDWGLCQSHCDELNEDGCRVADGCRAVYALGTDPATATESLVYRTCWSTAQSGPIRGGDCSALDADACSLHDDCIAVHEVATDVDGIGSFVSCGAEDQCATDAATQQLRNPETGQCETTGSSPCSEDNGAPLWWPDWGYCGTHCDALDETACKTADGCRAIYGEAAFTGCWATAQSGPVRGGTCTAFDAYECSRHDDCAAQYADSGFVSCRAE